MSRRKSSQLRGSFRRLLRSLFANEHVAKSPHQHKRRLKFESLEGRALLASDLASIAGIDTFGTTPMVGATINLYQDDGDGLFEPTTDDTLLDTKSTGAGGAYRFDRLSDGDYWLQQPAQTLPDTTVLSEAVSPFVTISAAQAQGVAGTTIDDFADGTAQTVTGTFASPTASDATNYVNALGGERDLLAQLTSGGAGETVTLDSQAGRLLFSSTLNAQGHFTATYDGDDDDAGTLSFGLNSVDLTDGGASNSLQIAVRADQPNASVKLRVYTDATHFSESSPTFTIPGTDTLTSHVFEFATDFTTGTGATDPADFTSVKAIELIVDTGADGTDGRVTLLGAYGPTVIAQNITNLVDLSLTKTKDIGSPNVGDQITFTITVNSAALGVTATNVVVKDLLPSELNFVSKNPSQGSYDESTGVWTVGSLASGGQATLEIVAALTSSAAITNTAEITAADQPDTDSTVNNQVGSEDDQASVAIDAPTTANLTLTKEVDNEAPNMSSNVTFTLTLRNAGPDQATGVFVTDLLPTGLTFFSKTVGQGTYDESTGVWNVGNLDSDGETTLTIVAIASTLNQVTNTAEVTAVNEFDPDSTPNDGQGDDFASITVDAVACDLSLTKTKDIASPNVGDDITFTITLHNDGPDEATGIVVEDLLPPGLVFVSKTVGQGTYDESTGAWNVGSLANGESVTLEIVATLTTSASITNTAEVMECDVVDTDSSPHNHNSDQDDQASITIDAPPAADLSLTKQVNNPTPSFGSNVTFTLTLHNSGPDNANNIIVEDLLPAGLTFVSKTVGQGTYNESTGAWNVGSLDSDEDVTLTIVATVNTTNLVTNTAEVTDVDEFDPTSTPDDGQGDDFASATVDAPNIADLSLTKTKDIVSPNVGDNITFTITVANTGPDQATGVTVQDLLPTGLTFVSKTVGQGTYDESTGVWTVGTVNNSTNATLKIVAKLITSAAVTNTAEITASDILDPDSTPNNHVASEDDQASLTIDAPPAADLSVTNGVNNATPNLGSNVTFTVVVANGGPDQATSVNVTDLLPASLTFVSSTATQGTYTSGTGVWAVGSINSGANATLTIVATVTSTSLLTTTAQVTSVTEHDPDSTPGDGAGDDFATAAIDAPPAADLSLTLVPSSATPNLGSNVTYTLTLTNGGPDQATGVSVTDLLPSGLTFVSASPIQGSYVSGTGIWAVGSVNSGASATLQIVATVNSTAAITNTAQVTASGVFDPDSIPNDGIGDDFATANIDAPAAADLSLTNVPSSATPNFKSNVTFTLTLTNGGPDQATGVSVTDLLPSGLTFVSATASQGTYVSGTGVWTVGSVNSAANATLTIVATVNSTTAIANTAQVTASGVFDPDSTPNDGAGDDFATANIDAPAAADLKVSKTSSLARSAIGQNVTFTVTVTNDGPDQATNVTLNDLLPSSLAFVSSSVTQGAYVSGTGVWTVGSLNSGSTATLTIVANTTANGAKVNVAQVTASDQFDPDSTPNNNATGEDDRASVTVSAERLSKRRFLAR